MIALLCAAAVALPQLEASVSVGSSVRRLFFRDRLSPTLATWQSGALAVGGLSLTAYPATGKLPVIDDIGAYGTFSRSLESTTLTEDGTLAFTTQATTWELGLRYRLASGGRERAALSIGYGSLRAAFMGAHLPGYLLPSGTVQYWRPGLEGRVYLGPVSVALGGAYLAIVRQDFLSAYFPRARRRGVEGTLKISAPVGRVVLTLSGRYQRYFYSLNPEPYDPYVAGGALDEVFAVDLACGYRL